MQRNNRIISGILSGMIFFFVSCSASSSNTESSNLPEDTSSSTITSTEPFAQEISISELTTQLNETEVASVTISPDSSYMAVGRLSGEVELWDLSTGKVKFTVDGTRSLDASCVADYTSFFIVSYFNNGGDYFATTFGGGQGGEDCTDSAAIALWSISDGSLLQQLNDVDGERIEDLAISQDGTIITAVVHCCGGTDWVSIWSFDTGEKINEVRDQDNSGFHYIYYEVDAFADGFIASANTYSQACQIYGHEEIEFCHDIFEYTIFDLNGEILETFISIAPPGLVGQLVSPDGEHIIQNLPKELEYDYFKLINAGFVSNSLGDLGIPVAGAAAYLSDGSIVTLSHAADSLNTGDKQISHWDITGKLLFQYLIHTGNYWFSEYFSSEDRGFNLKSSNGIDLIGVGDSDAPIIHLRSDSCESNFFGAFVEGRVSQAENLTALITFKNGLVLFDSKSPCQTNADADRAYDQLGISNDVDTIPAEVSVVVNCSGLTFDDDLPIGPCSEGYGVSMIQNSLISYGYQIEPDGQYGQATADAVSQFQGVEGLTITGTVDALTYAALGPMGVGTDLNGDGVVGPNEIVGD